jgi:hypothetical protein
MVFLWPFLFEAANVVVVSTVQQLFGCRILSPLHGTETPYLGRSAGRQWHRVQFRQHTVEASSACEEGEVPLRLNLNRLEEACRILKTKLRMLWIAGEKKAEVKLHE